jgi:photosystem II stability/assembly factor-like uncharacterized protein
MQRIKKVIFTVAPFLVCAGLLAAALFIKPRVTGDRINPPVFELRDKYFGAAVAGEGVIWLAGNNGKIIKSADWGKSWKEQDTPGRWNLQDVASWDAKKAIAVGNEGIVLRTINGGLSWEEVVTPKSEITNKFMRVKIDNKQRVWIVGEMGALLVSTDYGETWARAMDEKDVGLTDLSFVGDKKIIVTGEFGTFMVSRDGGSNWEEMNSPVEATLMGIVFKDELHGVAVGLEGVILVTDDGGESWVQVVSPSRENLFSVAWSGVDWVIVGDKGTFLKSVQSTAVWEQVSLGANDQCWRMEIVVNKGSLVLAGNSSGIMREGKWQLFTN